MHGVRRSELCDRLTYVRTPCVKIMTTYSTVTWWVKNKYKSQLLRFYGCDKKKRFVEIVQSHKKQDVEVQVLSKFLIASF